MLKFLRTHNKKILVFAGSLLMVLFLLPQAWQSLGRTPQDQVAFRIDGRNFTGRDLMHAQERFRVLVALQENSGVTLFRLNIDRSAPIEHWMMLVYEAKKQGLIGGGSRVDELVGALAEIASQRYAQLGTDPTTQAQYAAQMRDGILARLDQVVEELRAELGPPVVESAVAEIFGVQRLLDLNQAFASFSEPEMDTLAIRYFDTALADLALVEYLEALPEVAEPTTDELVEHFVKYKDTIPSEDGSQIGYRLPDAVQLEAVEVDLARVRAAITIDDIEVNKRWRQNKALYGESFASARDRVEGEIRDERLDVIVRALEEIARRDMFRASRDLESDGVWKKLPPNWEESRTSFEDLAAAFNAEIAKSVTLSAPAATVTIIDAWETEKDLTSRSIGRSFATIRGQPMGFPALALQVRELAPDSDAGVQVGIAFGPLMVPREKLAYARVLAARPAGPPQNVEEVRTRAIADWKKLRAFEKLSERIDEIRGVVRDAGRIDALNGAFQRPLMQVGVEVNRMGATINANQQATVANTQAMRDAIMDAAAKWDPTVDVTTIPIADRVVIVPLPDRFGIGAAVITGRYPVSREVVRAYLPQLISQYSYELSNTGQIESPFSLERIKQRLGYTAPERKKAPAEEEDTPAEKQS